MLLIYPPVVRASEPPLGVARLSALLRAHGLPVRVLDLCAEGLRWLAELPPDRVPVEPGDTWTRLALRRRERHLRALTSPAGYGRFDCYRAAVGDLNRAVGAASSALSPGAVAGLADYRESSRSPLRRSDLLSAAAHFKDNPFFPFFSARIDAALSEFSAAEVGLSVNFLSQALCAFAIIGYLSRTRPGIRIVLGGGLITSWAAQGKLSVTDDFGGLVAAVVPGRGEDELLGFLGAARAVPTPAPDFSDFGWSGYFAPGPIVPYTFSFGCPWRRCTFCPEKAEGSRYEGLRIQTAIAQVQELAERHSPSLIHFTDNEIGPAYLRALAASPPGAPWYGFARFSRDLLDPELCAALASSGCRMLQLGLESGDQAVLDAMEKGTRTEEISRILANLAAAGIGVYAYVLFGTPAEDRRAALATRDFVAAHADKIDFLNVAVFNLPTASAEALRLRTRPFYEGELSLYAEFEHPTGWNRDEVRGFLARDFESDARIRPILRRNPPVFTSNHAPFFLSPGGPR
jgi:hypothetical protein